MAYEVTGTGGDRHDNKMGKIGCCLEISIGVRVPGHPQPLLDEDSSASRATMAQGLPAGGRRWQSGTGRLTPSDR